MSFPVPANIVAWPGAHVARAPRSLHARAIVFPPARSPSRRLSVALATSTLAHALLAAVLALLFAGEAARPARPVAVLVAQLTAPVPTAEPVRVAPRAAEPAIAEVPAPPPRARSGSPLPQPRRTPVAPITQEYVQASQSPDDDGAPDATFEPALAGDLAGLPRLALTFDSPPAIDVPVEALRGIPQWRIRALVQVNEAGAVQLVRVAPYEPRLIAAIDAGLVGARARLRDDTATLEPGWAIVDFWFELASR